MKSTILCIGGPYAGEQISANTTLPNYAYLYIAHHEKHFYLYSPEVVDAEDAVVTMAHGYEQHCKAVAERNKPSVLAQQTADSCLMGKELQDHYTASFLRSCKNVTIISPYGDPCTLTLAYGRSQHGTINDNLEFIATDGENRGRISNPIFIIP